MTVIATTDSRVTLDREYTVPVVLRYDPADPHAVQITFINGGDETTWTFARELLDDGLTRPAGLADVQIWPIGCRHLALHIASHEGCCLFRLNADDVTRFLARTYTAVPPGREHLDLDAELDALLGGTR